jgi:hypothetical protein
MLAVPSLSTVSIEDVSMSKQLTLRAALAAFMGDGEAACDVVAIALHSAVTTYAQHGTRAPLDDASAFCANAKGNAKRFAALRAGWDAVAPILRTVKPGKSDAEASQDAATRCADAFTLAAGAVLGAVAVKGKGDPVKAGTQAAGRLAKLTPAHLRRVLATNEGRDMLAAIARVQAEGEARAVKAKAKPAPTVAAVAQAA